jgi:hypothetical protein
MTQIHDRQDTKTPRSHYDQMFAGVDEFAPDVTPKMQMLYQRDPKGCAVQGEYPQVVTNEAWAPSARGDATPLSRYQSCDLLALDKRRHATPLDGGTRSKDNTRLRVVMDSPGSPGFKSNRSAQGEGKLYKSSFTMQQHKKKHLCQVQSSGSRGGLETTQLGDFSFKKSTPGVQTPGRSPTPMGGPGAPPVTADTKGNNGYRSQRELQFCKRFHTVDIRPGQDLKRFDEELPDRPWPRPGTGVAMAGSPTSETSWTPPYPASARTAYEEPPTASGRAHHTKSITKYSAKSGVRNSVDSSASDPNLLHSSQLELAERKANCATSMRHNPQTVFRDERSGSLASADSVVRMRGPGEVLKSQKQLEYSKTLHRFAHDDPRRMKPTPRTVPVPPTPRSGQWTPAHA